VRRTLLALLVVLGSAAPAVAQAPVTYQVSVPEPQHHWIRVEATFPDLPAGTAQVMMSRSSPGRYAIHEFAKNVYDLRIDDGSGKPLAFARPSASEWDVAQHSGVVRVQYKVFGDVNDGTYLGVDTSHAHINIPSALVWVRGLESRPARVTFQPPPNVTWRVATQLHPTDDPYTFTAANLSYLIDSPVEFSNFVLQSFSVDQPFRVALHHDGSDRDAAALASDVARIVKESRAVFRELPAYENGYTFLIDLQPYVTWDGMEHRNSTVITVPGALREPDQRLNVLSTIAHEFFHSWNVERLRPRSLEPFRLDAVNQADELWFAEGFTNYYEVLIMTRAGFLTPADLARNLGSVVDTVVNSPARQYRSVEEISRLASLTDGAAWNDRTNWDNTSMSYYTWGSAIALALDLSLRERSGSKVTLDDFMRALWRQFGRVRSEEGVVARPYTTQDLTSCLAEVAHDAAFAEAFFERYVHGRDVADYRSLLARAGLVVRKQDAGRAWIGPLPLRLVRGAAIVTGSTWEGTPAYDAGLDQDDEILSLDGEVLATAERVSEILRRHKPGDRIRVVVRRRGFSEQLSITAKEDPSLEIVPAETSGRPLSPAEASFRAAWLTSQQ